MSRPLSPDELDLAREELSDDDMADWTASIESDAGVIRDEIDQLTRSPRAVLAAAHDKPNVTGGRKATMATLEKRGLVRRDGKKWQLTNFGRNVAQYLAQTAKP